MNHNVISGKQMALGEPCERVFDPKRVETYRLRPTTLDGPLEVFYFYFSFLWLSDNLWHLFSPCTFHLPPTSGAEVTEENYTGVQGSINLHLWPIKIRWLISKANYSATKLISFLILPGILKIVLKEEYVCFLHLVIKWMLSHCLYYNVWFWVKVLFCYPLASNSQFLCHGLSKC